MKTKPSKQARPHTKPWQIMILTILGIAMIITGFLAYPLLKPTGSGTTLSSFTPTPPDVEPTQPVQATISLPDELIEQGMIFFSMSDGAANHLFTYHPQLLSITYLTNNLWDDNSPAISPDGEKMVFSSRKNGFWNLYLSDFTNGTQTQLTDSLDYEGSPSWSPDNQWITYESNVDGDLNVYIQNTFDPSIAPIRLTDSSSPDFSPNWSSSGRMIAYVSTSGHDTDIWLANLDSSDQRFTNLTNSLGINEQRPIWSPDGQKLAWVSDQNGINEIWVWEVNTNPKEARRIGRGDWPAWSPNGSYILTSVNDANQVFLTAYQLSGLQVALPPIAMAGQIHGLDWKVINPKLQNSIFLPATDNYINKPLVEPVISVPPIAPIGRYSVVALPDVDTPYPYLHDSVDEAFTALRAAIGRQAGWDLLLSLQNAYIPLTSLPAPGIPEDWLYTGRAFAFSTQPSRAGWMIISRENYSGIIYWRVFIKARYQDGSQGSPLMVIPWNLDARYSGDPVAYEQGGTFGEIPSGYWIDLTDLAFRYGWQRLPALSNWRTYYPAARFNQFVITGGLSWLTAMRELYPEEALITPTYIPTYTATPIPPTVTPTKRIINSATPTAVTSVPTIIPSSTLQPTFTP